MSQLLAIIITYDVSGKHSEIKKEMKELGYRDYLIGENKSICYLPNTTLAKDDMLTLEQSNTDLTNVVAKINKELKPNENKVLIQRCMSFIQIPWRGINGEPHKEN